MIMHNESIEILISMIIIIISKNLHHYDVVTYMYVTKNIIQLIASMNIKKAIFISQIKTFME
mgnify:CR=1 FL=1